LPGVLLAAGADGEALATLDDFTVEEADPALSDAERVHAASGTEVSANRTRSILMISKDSPVRFPRPASAFDRGQKKGKGIEALPLPAMRLRLRAGQL
jgi:hypothetical protein